MLVRVVIALIAISTFCSADSVSDDGIVRFTALHNRYGAHLGLFAAANLEEYAGELIVNYEQFELKGGLDAPFRSNNIPFYWVHAVLHDRLPPHLSQQAETFLREGKPSTGEETIAAIILLDKLNRKEFVIEHWCGESSQMQFELLKRLVGKGNRYTEFAPRIANAVDHYAQVGWQVSPDSGFSVDLRFVVDCYLLDLIRDAPEKHKELDSLISTEYLQTVAKASRRTISDDSLLAVHKEFLAGKHDEHLGCGFRFEFALTEEFARDLLRVEFSGCRVDRYRGLRTIWDRYPEIVDPVLEKLAASDKQEDLRVVLKFFGGPIFRRLDDCPIVVEALKRHLKSTKAEFLTDVQAWPITCAAFSESSVGVEVAMEVNRDLAAETITKLNIICEDINRRCPRTFFAKSLEEAVLGMKGIKR